jgi:hypothetical protein
MFSLYTNTYKKTQGSKLSDSEELSMMLQYNYNRGVDRELYGEVLFTDEKVYTPFNAVAVLSGAVVVEGDADMELDDNDDFDDME